MGPSLSLTALAHLTDRAERVAWGVAHEVAALDRAESAWRDTCDRVDPVAVADDKVPPPTAADYEAERAAWAAFDAAEDALYEALRARGALRVGTFWVLPAHKVQVGGRPVAPALSYSLHPGAAVYDHHHARWVYVRWTPAR